MDACIKTLYIRFALYSLPVPHNTIYLIQGYILCHNTLPPQTPHSSPNPCPQPPARPSPYAPRVTATVVEYSVPQWNTSQVDRCGRLFGPCSVRELHLHKRCSTIGLVLVCCRRDECRPHELETIFKKLCGVGSTTSIEGGIEIRTMWLQESELSSYTSYTASSSSLSSKVT